MAEVPPIPEEYPRLTPYLHVDGASDAIEFYTNVLGAQERARMGGPDGKVGHAELAFGDAMVMLADEYPEMNVRGPRHYGGSAVSLHLYVEDVDAVHAAALAAGAKELRAPIDEFYGDRIGTFEDPWGHTWHLASHIEDVSPEDMERRAAEKLKNG